MYPFIESICLLDGELRQLPYHQARMERARKEELNCSSHPDLSELISIPAECGMGRYKCRLPYGQEYGIAEFLPHRPLSVSSVRLVNSDEINYRHKYRDRTALDSLYEQRRACDDIIIIKKGCLTDSYYANLALWDGSTWYTPDTPLLPGTMRASLIDKGIIIERRIQVQDIGSFKLLRLINAMNSLNESPDIPVSALIF